MKIDLAKVKDFDELRGMSGIKKPLKLYNWRKVESDDLNYLLRSILGPYRVEIQLKENR